MESMISDPHIGTVAPMHFSYSTLNSSLEGCEVSSGGHPLSAVAEDSNQSVTSTDQSVLTPGELISKLDMVVKKLQKKDYRNLFMWPWTESFAPGRVAQHQSTVVIFRPNIMGRKIIMCFLQILPNLHHGAVGSASAWQTRGPEFEPVLMRYIFSGKYPGA